MGHAWQGAFSPWNGEAHELGGRFSQVAESAAKSALVPSGRVYPSST